MECVVASVPVRHECKEEERKTRVYGGSFCTLHLLSSVGVDRRDTTEAMEM